MAEAVTNFLRGLPPSPAQAATPAASWMASDALFKGLLALSSAIVLVVVADALAPSDPPLPSDAPAPPP